MGNVPSLTSKNVTLYNSDTTEFWSFDTDDETANVVGTIVSASKKDRCTASEVLEFQKENGIDGLWLTNIPLSPKFCPTRKQVFDKITYLKLLDPKPSKGPSFFEYIQLFPNLDTLIICARKVEHLSDKAFWMALKYRNFQRLDINVVRHHWDEPKDVTPAFFPKCLRTIFSNCKVVKLGAPWERKMLECPDLYEAYLAKGDKRIGTLNTDLLDIPNPSRQQLESFLRALKNGPPSLRVVRMKNKDSLAALLQFLSDKKQTISELQLCDSDGFPLSSMAKLELECLHFYGPTDLSVVKKALTKCPAIKKLSSGQPPISRGDMKDLQEHIRGLKRPIDVGGVRVERPPK